MRWAKFDEDMTNGFSGSVMTVQRRQSSLADGPTLYVFCRCIRSLDVTHTHVDASRIKSASTELACDQASDK